MKDITAKLPTFKGNRGLLAFTIGMSLTVLTACSKPESDNVATVSVETAEFEWAVNVGGAEYLGVDGVVYHADTLTVDAPIKSMEYTKGSQDGELYETFREGELSFSKPLENGKYDVTFMFAEPEDRAIGSRVFNVFVEDQLHIRNLDVRGARDGKHISALDRAVSQVEVTDGQLDIRLEAIKDLPILNGLIIRDARPRDDEKWELVWQDEFNQPGAPDSSRWSYNIWPAKKVNDEDQAYTDRAKNVRVEDGKLIIQAFKESYNGAEYTSGRIHTQGKGDIHYGRIEVRAKLPAGQGTWPAIWMLPSDPYKYATTCKENEDWQGSSTCNAWPNSGEIDIMEHVGFDMNKVHGTVHTKAYYWAEWEQRKGSVETVNAEQAFHTYSLEWTPEQISIFFNDTLYFTYVNEQTGWKAWPFDHPFHLILNLAVGGMWGRAGGPVDDSIFPVQMEVDYVRVYKAKS
ncbi:family 16 glycosylhydrolase [Thalassotalea aquiviva]|uniref:family 16 glycosylhydrolase n=1 Tax=Thalassotalea aquiviva TaxID=3242415 RepID=UPI00352BC369